MLWHEQVLDYRATRSMLIRIVALNFWSLDDTCLILLNVLYFTHTSNLMWHQTHFFSSFNALVLKRDIDKYFCFNLSPSGQNGPHLAGDIFRCIFVNEKFCNSIMISLEIAAKGPIDNNPALIQIMDWRRIRHSHELNHCWPDSLTHIRGTGGD